MSRRRNHDLIRGHLLQLFFQLHIFGLGPRDIAFEPVKFPLLAFEFLQARLGDRDSILRVNRLRREQSQGATKQAHQ